MTDPNSIPLAIYEGFVVFGTIKHTQKSPPVGIYGTFVGSKWTKMTPGGHPIALCLCLAKTAQTLEHLEHLRPLTKKVFEGVFRSGICRKRTTLEHLERSGEFKGVREEGEVFEVRGPGKATIVESSMSRKGVVQNVPESWVLCLKVVPISNVRSACTCPASPT